MFKNVKGFNYFSATKDDDLKKYLFENFDYTFFPATYDVAITLEAPIVSSVEVFGSPDSQQVPEYNKDSAEGEFVITKIGTSFPSDISIKEGEMHTFGGLILIKLRKAEEGEEFRAKIKVDCKDLQMQSIHKEYEIEYKIPVKEQFFSSGSVQEAMDCYQYVSEIKALIKQVNEGKDMEERKTTWLSSMEMLEKTCPKSKQEEVEKIMQIVKKKLSIE